MLVDTGRLRRSVNRKIGFYDGKARIIEEDAELEPACCDHSPQHHGHEIGCLLCDCAVTNSDPDYMGAAGLPSNCRKCGHSHGEFPCVVVHSDRTVFFPENHRTAFYRALERRHSCGETHSPMQDQLYQQVKIMETLSAPVDRDESEAPPYGGIEHVEGDLEGFNED